MPVYIKEHASPPGECPGTVADPAADSGFLCVYANEEDSIASHAVFGPGHPFVCSAASPLENCGVGASVKELADRFGFVVAAAVEETGSASGTWAVTAE